MKTRTLLISAVVGLLAATPALADYPSTVLGDGPLLYWRLGETGSAPANPVAANLGFLGAAQNGAFPGAPMSGMPGPLVGDATSKSVGSTGSPYNPEGYVDVPYSAALNGAKLTVEMWVKLNNFNNSPACPLSSRGSGGANGFLFFANNGGDQKWWFRTYNGTTRNSVTSTNLAQVGVWTHLVGVVRRHPDSPVCQRR